MVFRGASGNDLAFTGSWMTCIKVEMKHSLKLCWYVKWFYLDYIILLVKCISKTIPDESWSCVLKIDTIYHIYICIYIYHGFVSYVIHSTPNENLIYSEYYLIFTISIEICKHVWRVASFLMQNSKTIVNISIFTLRCIDAGDLKKNVYIGLNI